MSVHPSEHRVIYEHAGEMADEDALRAVFVREVCMAQRLQSGSDEPSPGSRGSDASHPQPARETERLAPSGGPVMRLVEAPFELNDLIANLQDVLWRVELVGMPLLFRAVANGETTIEEALFSFPPRLAINVVYSSPATYRFYGLSPEEKMRQPLTSAMTPESLAKSMQFVCERLQREASGERCESFTLELDEFRGDGELIHTEVKCRFLRNDEGIPVGLEGTTRDITIRRRIQDELERQNRFQNLISQLSTEFIRLSLDEVDLTLERSIGAIARFFGAQRAMILMFVDGFAQLTCTHEWCETLEYSAKERLRSIRLAEFSWIAPRFADAETVLLPDVDALKASAVREHEEYRRQGVRATAAAPMKGPLGPLGIVVLDFLNGPQEWSPEFAGQIRLVGNLCCNVLLRQNADKELRETNQRLEAALREVEDKHQQVVRQERLRAIGQMASGIAHDLNNSLSVVLAHGEALYRDSELGADARQHAAWMLTGGHDAAEIVRRLRSIYRPSEAERERGYVDLRSLLQEIPALTRPKWRDETWNRGISIQFDTDIPTVSGVKGIASELRQVLINLVFNAVDAMPSGGRLFLRAFDRQGEVVIELDDTGVGMTDEQRRRCFEPFYSKKPYGVGLGLSLCEGIVKSHGGQIEVEDIDSHGSRFRITLPATAAAASSEYQAADLSKMTTKIHILYIDDDERVRLSVAALMAAMAQSVELAESGERGVEIAAGGGFDLVMTDLGMPGMNGLQVTRELRRRCPNLPVILVTGWTELTEIGQCEDAERPDGVLTKPLTVDQLRTVIHECTSKRRPPRASHSSASPDAN